MTSCFVCPYQGIYLFTLNFNTYNGDGLRLALMKTSVILVQAVADLTDDGAKTTGSASVVVECGPNEMVWINASDNPDAFEGAYGRTHFMGYLLHAYQTV